MHSAYMHGNACGRRRRDIFSLSPRVGPMRPLRCPRAKPTVLHLHQRVATAAALHGGLAGAAGRPAAAACGRGGNRTNRQKHRASQTRVWKNVLLPRILCDVSLLSGVHSIPESLNLSARSRELCFLRQCANPAKASGILRRRRSEVRARAPPRLKLNRPLLLRAAFRNQACPSVYLSFGCG